MRTGRFYYAVKLGLEFTGLELAVMQYHASQHYDHTCRSFFERGNTGYGWIGQFRWKNGEKEPADAPEGTVDLEVSSRELDLCMKIVERLGYEEGYAMLKEILGQEMPEGAQEMGVLAANLRARIKEVFYKIHDEWRRLDKEQEPAPEFDGQLKCPRCGSDEVEWQEYVLETRQLLGIKEGELAVDLDSAKQVYECTKDEGLACKACFHEFKVPAGLGIDHTERQDFERKRAGGKSPAPGIR